MIWKYYVFENYSQVGAFVEKKTDEIKICDCTSSTFPFSPSKV